MSTENPFLNARKVISTVNKNKYVDLLELKKEKSTTLSKHTKPETWTEYLTQLFIKDEELTTPETPEIMREAVKITIKDVKEALQKLRNRKYTGPDKIPNELLKYGGHKRT